MYHPSRGGVRGGSDQFDWEDVKADKHRESYLGHSVKAPVGRWQKGKDLHWYTKSGKVNTQLSKQQERDAVKKLEAEALAIALGKQTAVRGPTGLTKQELAEVCRKGQVERDSMDIERVEGMGFGSSRARLMDTSAVAVKETLSAYGSAQMRRHEGRPDFEDKEKQEMPLRNSASAEQKKKTKEKKKKKSKKERKHKKRQESGYSSTEEKKRLKRKHDHSDRDPNSAYKETKRKRRSEIESDISAAKCEKHSRTHFTSANVTTSAKRKDQKRTQPDDNERAKVRRQRHDTE